MYIVKHITVVIFATWLAGCASQPGNMIYDGEQKQYASAITTNTALGEVTGGRSTNPLWTSQISNEAFGTAIIESLKSQGLYAEDGNYRLTVALLELKQPLLAINAEVKTKVQYILTDTSSDTVLLDETIEATYTATMSDAVLGAKRLRMANEGSAKANIGALLDQLAALDIDLKITMAGSALVAN